MPSPLPRRSDWKHCFAHPPSRVTLSRYDGRVGLRIVLFEACSAFTRVTACTLALSPYFVTRLSEGFSHFVSSIAAPVASGWSRCRVGLAPTGKRRLCTAHVGSGHWRDVTSIGSPEKFEPYLAHQAEQKLELLGGQSESLYKNYVEQQLGFSA